MTNGEKFKTAEERVNHFSAFCDASKRDICKCTDKCARDVKCALEWLELEYKEAEPKPCPFCGCDKVKVTSVFEGSPYYVFCTKCKAHSSIFHTIETAVAAWNKRENG